MKKYLFMVVFFIGVVLFSTTSCPPPDESAGTSKVYGTVTNLKTGDPVAGVVVTAGGKSAVTDTSGNYSIIISSNFSNKTLNIRSDGYAYFSRPLGDNKGNEVKLDPDLIPVDIITVIHTDETDSHTIETADGAKVDFPDLSDSGIAEDLRISVTHFDVSSDELASVPGNFMGSDGGEIVPIVSQGMLDVNITGNDTGNEYDFQGEGLVFEITLPVTGDPDLADDTIDLWWYNADTGLWVKEGTATKTNINGEDFYVGTVTHFTTWNMDFKMADRVRIHGTINDPDDDYYDITLRGPGILTQFSMNDHDLMIINMIPDVVVELTIVKRSTGYQNVLVFETIPTSGDTVELGDLFSPDFLPFVYDLSTYQDGTNVTFTWTDPDHDDFLGLRIEYDSTTDLVNPGIEQYTATGLPEGTMEFSLTALYTDDRESTTVTRRIRVGDYAEFSIDLGLDSYFEDIILQNYSAVDDWYTLYYKFGVNTDYTEYSGPVMLPVQSIQLMIEIDSYELAYDDDGYPYVWYVQSPTWYREDEYNNYYGEEIDIDQLDSDGDGDDPFTIYFYGCEY